MLLFQRTFQCGCISKTSALRGGEEATLQSQAHTVSAGEVMETIRKRMKATFNVAFGIGVSFFVLWVMIHSRSNQGAWE